MMKINVTDSNDRVTDTFEVASWKRGMFCRTYKIKDDPYHILKVCRDEHSMPEIYTFPDRDVPHVPETEKLGWAVIRGVNVTVYKQKLYQPFRSETNGLKLIKLARKLQREWFGNWSSPYDPHPLRMYSPAGQSFLEFASKAGLDPSVMQALEILETWGSSYGATVTWDIGPRNLALDDNGDLILLDVFCDGEEVWKLRQAKIKRHRAA